MREVVADTSPLQYLHQSGILDLLPALYGKVTVPTGVMAELDAGLALGVNLPDLSALEWVRVVTAPHRRILPLAVDLGRGEREVLSLAVENADVLAILDDALARHFARHLGVDFTGTLGILLRAKAAGHLEAVAPVVERLQSLGFRLDAATHVSVVELAGEA